MAELRCIVPVPGHQLDLEAAAFVRHEAMLLQEPRMALKVKGLARTNAAQRQAVGERAAAIRRGEIGAVDGRSGDAWAVNEVPAW